jgi:serine/threonine-protein kinase
MTPVFGARARPLEGRREAVRFRVLARKRFGDDFLEPSARRHVTQGADMLSPQKKLPTTIAGRYQPVRFLGAASMGALYEVEHALTKERLALKAFPARAGLSGDALESFKREARLSVLIESDHVVSVTDADVAPELEGAPFIVMERLEGRDLEAFASRQRPDPASVVEWMRQIGVVIDRAHALGVVHRDLRPDNIFIANREGGPPIAKILDFGVAKMIEEGGSITTSDEVLGTPPAYMAPEQVTAGAAVTPATDRYALGLVAYRALTGERYYSGDIAEIVMRLLHEPLRPPSARHPELGRAFDIWFERACHRTPSERFASASEQVEALAAALGLHTETAEIPRRAPPAATAARRAPRWRAVLVAVAVTVAAAAIVGMVVTRGSTSATALRTRSTSR